MRTSGSGRPRAVATCWRSRWRSWVATWRVTPPSASGTATALSGPRNAWSWRPVSHVPLTSTGASSPGSPWRSTRRRKRLPAGWMAGRAVDQGQLRVGERLEHLVGRRPPRRPPATPAAGWWPPRRPRARPGTGRHRRRAPAGRRRCGPPTGRRARRRRCRPPPRSGRASAGPVSMPVMRAWAWGLRTVAPKSIPGTTTSLENSNDPSILAGTSGRATERPTRPTSARAAPARSEPRRGWSRRRRPIAPPATSTTAATMPS